MNNMVSSSVRSFAIPPKMARGVAVITFAAAAAISACSSKEQPLPESKTPESTLQALAGCPITTEPPDDPRIQMASADASIAEHIQQFQEMGWTVCSWNSALVEEDGQGNWAVALPVVGTDGSRLSLVYSPGSDGNPEALVRPEDESAETSLQQQLAAHYNTLTQEEVEDLLSTESSSPGCYLRWSCRYVATRGYNFGCVSGWGNPYGYYEVTYIRSGDRHPRCGYGLYANCRGWGIACPFPNSLASFAICTSLVFRYCP